MFIKPTLYNIFSYILFNVLIDAIRPKVEKKFKTCFIFTRLFRGGQSGEYEKKSVLFLYAVGLVAATKTVFKRKEKLLLS